MTATLHMEVTQLTAIHSSHVIAKYGLETNMSTKLGIYANVL